MNQLITMLNDIFCMTTKNSPRRPTYFQCKLVKETIEDSTKDLTPLVYNGVSCLGFKDKKTGLYMAVIPVGDILL